MMLLNVHYTKQQVLDDIQAIGDGRFEEMKLPLAVIKREEPKAFTRAYNRARYTSQAHREKIKVYRKATNYKERQKEYFKKNGYKVKLRRASVKILKQRHKEEYLEIFKEVYADYVSKHSLNHEYCNLC